MVKCWDLEANKVIRHYHGHLSGVYALALHPTLDVLVTAGRDASARVWDMRTKAQVHVLAGHTGTVGAVRTQASDPQVITGSMDSTVRLWDLAAGRTRTTLTHHKKSVRALDVHPTEFSFVSASAGGNNIKKWKCPEGTFVCNFSGHDAIINALALNAEGVLFSGGRRPRLYRSLHAADGPQRTTARSPSGTTAPARRSRRSRTSPSRARSRPRPASSARPSTSPARASSPAARTRRSRSTRSSPRRALCAPAGSGGGREAQKTARGRARPTGAAGRARRCDLQVEYIGRMISGGSDTSKQSETGIQRWRYQASAPPPTWTQGR
jgi:WD40 repeat protein